MPSISLVESASGLVSIFSTAQGLQQLSVMPQEDGPPFPSSLFCRSRQTRSFVFSKAASRTGFSFAAQVRGCFVVLLSLHSRTDR